jgi:hypothetical protein
VTVTGRSLSQIKVSLSISMASLQTRNTGRIVLVELASTTQHGSLPSIVTPVIGTAFVVVSDTIPVAESYTLSTGAT